MLSSVICNINHNTIYLLVIIFWYSRRCETQILSEYVNFIYIISLLNETHWHFRREASHLTYRRIKSDDTR